MRVEFTSLPAVTVDISVPPTAVTPKRPFPRQKPQRQRQVPKPRSVPRPRPLPKPGTNR